MLYTCAHAHSLECQVNAHKTGQHKHNMSLSSESYEKNTKPELLLFTQPLLLGRSDSWRSDTWSWAFKACTSFCSTCIWWNRFTGGWRLECGISIAVFVAENSANFFHASSPKATSASGNMHRCCMLNRCMRQSATQVDSTRTGPFL